jgi:hypothetical protein
MKKQGIKKEDYVRPYGLSMERRKRFGGECLPPGDAINTGH